MTLFHFSSDPGIRRFEPRPVEIPSPRPPGREWLNGPLVWAVDDWHQPMYFFPRDCPRILLWPLPQSTEEDLARYFGERDCRMLAFIERAWAERLATAQVHRYALPAEAFEDLNDAGMWVSRKAVTPSGMETLRDLVAALAAANVELEIVESLVPLRDVWQTSLHASGLRLRNAAGWA